jgi:hypothetical protein
VETNDERIMAVVQEMTALMRAAGKRDAQGVRLLLDAAADPSRVVLP